MSGATGPAQSITVPNPNQPLTNGNTVDRVWWRFFNSLANTGRIAAASPTSPSNAAPSGGGGGGGSAGATGATGITGAAGVAVPDLSPEVSDLETQVALLMQRPYAVGMTQAAPAIYAPLVNGDLPGAVLVGVPDGQIKGPTMLSDPYGQCIMAQIR